MSIEPSPCVICKSTSLEELSGYARLPRVTSDCKPWPSGGRLFVCETCGAIQKTPDATWLDEIRRIYKAYQIYHLSDGAEQVIFSQDGTPTPRSRTIVDFVVSNLSHRETGHLIDLGCGNGSALANFSRALPGWKFDGSELSDQVLPRLREIPGFETLHTGTINKTYDVVSMIHSLEHMVSPGDTLAQAAALTRADGTVFVEVPDVETSPFDILVADHLTHFTRDTLGYLAGCASLDVAVLRNTLLRKEITLLAHRGAKTAAKLEPLSGRAIATQTLRWLEDVADAAAAASAETSGIGIFGTSISAMWLFGLLRDKVEFFVDEDASRVGQAFQGRPIVAPADAPASGRVFVPLVTPIAKRVAARLAGGPATYVTPPPMVNEPLA